MENVGLPPGLQTFSGTYNNDAAAAGVGLRGAHTTGRQVGSDLLRMMEDVDKVLNVLVLTDDDVEAQNRVTLSPNLPPDEHGPAPRVEFKHRARSARTRANREYVARQAARLLKAAGATRIYRMNFTPLILHIQSSMRMGSNPADSALDRSAGRTPPSPPRRSPRAPPRRSSRATSAATRGSAGRRRSRRSTIA